MILFMCLSKVKTFLVTWNVLFRDSVKDEDFWMYCVYWAILWISTAKSFPILVSILMQRHYRREIKSWFVTVEQPKHKMCKSNELSLKLLVEHKHKNMVNTIIQAIQRGVKACLEQEALKGERYDTVSNDLSRMLITVESTSTDDMSPSEYDESFKDFSDCLHKEDTYQPCTLEIRDTDPQPAICSEDDVRLMNSQL